MQSGSGLKSHRKTSQSWERHVQAASFAQTVVQNQKPSFTSEKECIISLFFLTFLLKSDKKKNQLLPKIVAIKFSLQWLVSCFSALSQRCSSAEAINVYIQPCHRHKPSVLYFLYETAHNTICGFSWIIRSWIAVVFFFFLFFLFGAISNTRQVPSSSSIISTASITLKQSGLISSATRKRTNMHCWFFIYLFF